jgi:hypothetical protein
MSFTGNEDQQITLTEGAALTAEYRNNAGQDPVLGHYVAKSILTDILTQTNCVGIRVYYGQKTNGEKQLVIVGVDADENDLYEGIIADRSTTCPPYCSTANPLNSD